MTAEIVAFAPKAEPDLVLVCDCGSTTHYHHANGSVSCGSCSEVMDGNTWTWRERAPAVPAEPEAMDDNNFKVVSIDTAEAFMRRRLLSADAGDMALVAVVYGDGSFSTWSLCLETAEQRAWAKRKLEEAGARVAGKD